MASLTKRGFSVVPFKVGPDFIDPGHHTRITGRTSRNLDGWMLSKTYNWECFKRNMQGADIAVVEGVMGLFDGYEGKSEAGSTAQMAKWLGLPVILVVDAGSMARSAAALVRGFERFDPNLIFAGVLFNNVGSLRHLEYLKEALELNVKMTCLGGITHHENLVIPERHLGLVTRGDYPLSSETIDKLSDVIEEAIEVDALIDRLPDINAIGNSEPEDARHITSQVRIGVAMDNAFCFYYQDNLDFLEASGAELVFFSPIEQNALPKNLDGIYLGGGYPELFAKQLSENETLRGEIKKVSMAGMPIYSECGGFMYLCREICDHNGNTYPMTGCFPFSTQMLPRLKALGYREIVFEKDTIIGKQGQTMRGHEFHYSELTEIPKGVETAYLVSPRSGVKKTEEGYRVARCLGSYIHLHFGSRPDAAKDFVRSCLEYKNEGISQR